MILIHDLKPILSFERREFDPEKSNIPVGVPPGVPVYNKIAVYCRKTAKNVLLRIRRLQVRILSGVLI